MSKNVVETIIKGSNKEFLNIPRDEYRSEYNKINIESAQLYTDQYFKLKNIEATPNVVDVELEPEFDNVKITIELDGEDNIDG
ncbi:hypothetical protein [Clostridium sp. DL1XJH146]